MLELEFMRLALAVGVVVGILAPAVGFFLVERRQALVGDGLGHVAFAGVAAGYLLGVSPVLTALVVAVVGALAIEWLARRGGAAGDQALALVFYTGSRSASCSSRRRRARREPLPVPLRLDPDGDAERPGSCSRSGSARSRDRVLYRGLVGASLDEEGSRVAGVPVGC
jgi:zinc transport system permease protein